MPPVGDGLSIGIGQTSPSRVREHLTMPVADAAELEVPDTLTLAPSGAWVTVAKFYHGLIALIGTCTLGLSIYLSITQPENGGPLNAVIFTLSYFTVLSNILAMATNWAMFANPLRDSGAFRWMRMTSLVMIVITGLIYAIVLAPISHPEGLGVYTNMGYHYIVPWATLLGFLLFGPRPRFTWDLVPKMMIVPVLWLLYTLVHGAFLTQPPPNPPETTTLGEPQHWYPYPFIDVNDPSPLIPGVALEGYAGVGVNLVVIVILGLVFATLFLGLDRLLSGFKKPTPLP